MRDENSNSLIRNGEESDDERDRFGTNVQMKREEEMLAR
jgi:hypothetical protein